MIGSSNVSRFYPDLDPKWKEDIKFEKCTKIEVLAAILNETNAEKVIVSVVENFLSDAVGDLKVKEDIEKAIDVAMKDYLAIIQVAADRIPNTKFALVEPMRRPALPWYETRLEEIIRFHNKCIQRMKRPNVDRINGLLQSTQHFDSFGVHLVPSSGISFVEMIIANADDLFEMMQTDVVEIDDEEMKESEEQTAVRSVSGREKSDVLPLIVATNSLDANQRMLKLEEKVK